jgi:ribosomal protein S18 acetylase RimI-like enzyme
MPSITLAPLTAEEFTAYYREAVSFYAAANVASGNWKPEDAQQRAEDAHATLLPDGVATPKNHFFAARNENRKIGVIWFAERDETSGPLAYVYDVRVDPDQRGKGYGRAVMEAVEAEVRKLGLGKIQLHVHGDNTAARKLYGSVGYAETNVVMRKQLD